jgi:hypothetical protein
MSVARCVEEVDSVEFSHWVALDGIDPFDKPDYYAAQLHSTLFNVNRDKETPPKTIFDSILFRRDDLAPPEETEAERQARIAASFERAFANAIEVKE